MPWSRLREEATITHFTLVAHQSLRSSIDLVAVLESVVRIENSVFGGGWLVQDGRPSAQRYQQNLAIPSQYNAIQFHSCNPLK